MRQRNIMLGEEIRVLREKAGISQADMARSVGVTPNTAWRWEAGLSNPRLKTYLRLLELLKPHRTTRPRRKRAGRGKR